MQSTQGGDFAQKIPHTNPKLKVADQGQDEEFNQRKQISMEDSVIVKTQKKSRRASKQHNQAKHVAANGSYLDPEQIKAAIYRQWVGRRNAIDLGCRKTNQNSETIASKAPNKLKKTNNSKNDTYEGEKNVRQSDGLMKTLKKVR